MIEYYDAMAPLSHPDVPIYLHRRIGVRVCDHLASHPGLGGRPAYQVESETVTLNTAAIAGWVPAVQLDARVADRLGWVVRQLDTALAELWRHRERLATELLQRTGNYPTSDTMPAIGKMLRDEVALREDLVAAIRAIVNPVLRENLAEQPDELPVMWGVRTTVGDLRRLWTALDALDGIAEAPAPGKE